jgi:SAM-dependent methyltransferase
MALNHSWRLLRPFMPRRAIDAAAHAHREYMRLRCWYQGVRERPLLKTLDLDEAIPAPFLRYRVDGTPDVRHFLTVGKRAVADMEAALGTIGKDLSSFRTILDFGCGCGRVLRWLRDRGPLPQELFGTDIDVEAIGWCQTHLGAGRFSANAGRPPLDMPADRFDFVYAISVFTHLREDYQRAWLAELARVTRPGGIVLLTVHGPSCSERLGPGLQRRLLAEGFLFHEADSARALFPRWYRASYQTPDYIRAAVRGSFTVLGQIPRALGGYQDIVLLQKAFDGRGANALDRLAG